MNEYLPDLEEREEEPEFRPAPRPRSRQQPPVRPSGPDLSKVALIVSILALVLAVAALFLALRPAEEEPEPPQEPERTTFQFGDRTLVPLEGMPLNPYDKEGFSTDSRGRVVYSKDGKRARTGIDVSTYQGEIHWPSVAADGIDFAIIRAGYRGYTEGGIFADQTFEQNIQGALNAGLEVGVYFFSQAITPEEAEEEAQYILSALNGREVTGPIVFDWEPIGSGQNARTDGLDNDTLTRCAAAFCAKVKEAGMRPAVYFNQSQGYLHYDLRDLIDHELWLAEYGASPNFYYHFDLWQYSHTGRVAGVDGDVDLDLDLRGAR